MISQPALDQTATSGPGGTLARPRAALTRAAAALAWTRALQRTAAISDDQAILLAGLVDGHAARDPEAPALLAVEGSLTYGALASRSNQYARWALAQGFEPGDTVCLMLGNGPDYLAIWLGLSRVGVVTALLNTQISGPPLAHCIALAAPKAAIAGWAYKAAFEAAFPDCPVWTHGDPATGRQSIEDCIAGYDGSPLEPHLRARATLRSRALLIYTSGTTGLPKAANVSHYRIRMWSEWFAGLMDAGPRDRLYDCLPMYHSIGGVAATGAMLAAGGAVAIRDKFSASKFWDDVKAWDCTIFQYIGELCRYLLNQDAHPEERSHRLRLCCGNGLRADIWEAFCERFAIPRVLEFYAATEGSFSLFNVEGEPGSIGRIPGFMAHRSPVALVRYDAQAGRPLRDPQGFCTLCEPDEAGEAIGRIAAGENGLATRFEGYTNQTETERKILRDVFEPGDAWFRSGDLMRKDTRGFYYFVDRTGDTFRWKGENVSTLEVEAVLGRCPSVIEANVYGVGVPGCDGKAGMAALVTGPGFSLDTLASHLNNNLPPFARPLFLRLCDEIAATSTFKPQKHDLVRRGFDPAQSDGSLYFHDIVTRKFSSLDHDCFRAICSGSMKI